MTDVSSASLSAEEVIELTEEFDGGATFNTGD
jgi:hypothetical protein